MNGNVFPLPFTTHVIFVAVGFIFFLIQFARLKYKYQIIMAAAVAATMLIYVKDTRMWFYGIGILEIGLLLMALVASIAEKRSRKTLAAAEGESAAEEKEETGGEE